MIVFDYSNNYSKYSTETLLHEEQATHTHSLSGLHASLDMAHTFSGLHTYLDMTTLGCMHTSKQMMWETLQEKQETWLG